MKKTAKYCKKIKCICALALTLIPTSLLAQKVGRKFFAAVFDGSPGLVNVNLELKKVAPVTSLPFVVSTVVKIIDCDKNGLPSKDELQLVLTFSNKVEALFEKVIKYTYAGTFAHDCVCLNYYFVSDTLLLREKLTILYKEKFPNRTLGLKLKEDKEWDTYLNFLYPGKGYSELKEPVIIKTE